MWKSGESILWISLDRPPDEWLAFPLVLVPAAEQVHQPEDTNKTLAYSSGLPCLVPSTSPRGPAFVSPQPLYAGVCQRRAGAAVVPLDPFEMEGRQEHSRRGHRRGFSCRLMNILSFPGLLVGVLSCLFLVVLSVDNGGALLITPY